MATVRQSITALYEESRKSAVDGAPMMAVIDTVPVADPALVADLGLDVAPDTPRQPAIVARFDELRRLAEVEARQEKTGQEKTGQGNTAQYKTRQDDQPLDDDLAGTFDTGLSAIDPAAIDPAAPETQILPSTPLEMSQAAEPALPEEPPAPDRGAGADLEIGDIQELVRQAWEDEAGIGKTDTRHQPVAADPEASHPEASHPEASHPEANGPAAVAAAATDMAPPVPTDIEMAMEEIAAAVVQSGDSTTPVDVAAMKAEIIAAMRSEMKTLLEAGLTSAVRTAVAEAVSEAVTNVLADMPHTADAAGTAKAASGDAPPAKAKAKTAAKKAPATRKAAAKKTAAKKAAVVKKLRADPTPDPDEA